MRLRLQKYIAQSGICSRRAAEILIAQGKVLINQSKVAQIGDSIDPNIDSVSLEGQTLRPRLKQYFVFHKPAKVLCSKKDPAGLPCLYQILPPALQHETDFILILLFYFNFTPQNNISIKHSIHIQMWNNREILLRQMELQ